MTLKRTIEIGGRPALQIITQYGTECIMYGVDAMRMEVMDEMYVELEAKGGDHIPRDVKKIFKYPHQEGYWVVSDGWAQYYILQKEIKGSPLELVIRTDDLAVIRIFAVWTVLTKRTAYEKCFEDKLRLGTMDVYRVQS